MSDPVHGYSAGINSDPLPSDGIERAAQRIHDRRPMQFWETCACHDCSNRRDARVILDATNRATEHIEALLSGRMSTGMGNEERIDDVYDSEGAAIYRRHLLLRALACLQGKEDV